MRVLVTVISFTLGIAALSPLLRREPQRMSYYVDSLGNDASTGVSKSSAWRTLARVNREVLHPGDCVLLRRGDSWSEKLVPSTSGTAEQPITFGAYGAGPRPIIDGAGVPLKTGEGLVSVYYLKHITVTSLEVRSSAADGIVAYLADGFQAIDDVVHHHQHNGIDADGSSDIVIRGNDVYGNNLSGDAAYSGVTVDRSKGGEIGGVLIESNRLHDNVGSMKYNGNGIKLGHTGGEHAVLRRVVIRNNEIYGNGNARQNQFGRGITASVDGDIIVEDNYVHDNASAGSYIGGKGYRFDLVYSRNFFRNNHLRGFGWIDDGNVLAVNNTVICDQDGYTCLGTEFNGAGNFQIRHNIYYLKPDPRYGAFIAIQEGAHMPELSDNIYWDALHGPGSRKFLVGDFQDPSKYHTFSEWITLTRDQHSREIDPREADRGFRVLPEFRLSPSMALENEPK